ncbi:hypothetical protein BHM03_00033191 [Ensete ventricosum]|nr:hypothetical protein BHM03_00033191 [Ensete ventricosum]
MSSSATVTSTLRHGSPVMLAAPSASGFSRGSSGPAVPGHTNDHIFSGPALVSGSRLSDPSGSAPQKYGWNSSSPLIAAPPPNPSAATRSTTW